MKSLNTHCDTLRLSESGELVRIHHHTLLVSVNRNWQIKVQQNAFCSMRLYLSIWISKRASYVTVRNPFSKTFTSTIIVNVRIVSVLHQHVLVRTPYVVYQIPVRVP